MKERQYFVALDDYEHGVVIRSLKGKSTDAVDDLIIKIGNAPCKKFRVIEKDRRSHDER